MQAFKRLGTKFVAGSRRHGPCVLFLNVTKNNVTDVWKYHQ